MEEFIGYGLVGVIALLLVLGIKKLFTKKKKLYDYEDEIILDNDMVHYGPFSGSYKNPYRKLALLLTISSSYLSASIDMKTIDNWGIMSWEETLVMRKTSDSSLSEIFIEMDRPFCICTNPRIVTPIGTSNYNEGDKIEATMIINNYKPKKIVFNVEAVFDDTGKNKLIVYDQKVDLAEGMPVLDKQGSEIIDIGKKEPLRSECEHFLSCIKSRKKPLTNSDSAIKVLKVLEACQQSMDLKGQSVYL